jgi:hypothetical protein
MEMGALAFEEFGDLSNNADPVRATELEALRLPAQRSIEVSGIRMCGTIKVVVPLNRCISTQSVTSVVIEGTLHEDAWQRWFENRI